MTEISAMCRWIVKNLGPDVPIHFSRFFPDYKLKNLPPTPEETLFQGQKNRDGCGTPLCLYRQYAKRGGEYVMSALQKSRDLPHGIFCQGKQRKQRQMPVLRHEDRRGVELKYKYLNRKPSQTLRHREKQISELFFSPCPLCLCG